MDSVATYGPGSLNGRIQTPRVCITNDLQDGAVRIISSVIGISEAQTESGIARRWTHSCFLTITTAGTTGQPVLRVTVGTQLNGENVVSLYEYLHMESVLSYKIWNK